MPLPRDHTAPGLYAAALRHLAGRAAHTVAAVLIRAALRIDPPTVRERTDDREQSKARHPSRGGVVPAGYAQGRADLQLVPAAPEGDPDL